MAVLVLTARALAVGCAGDERTTASSRGADEQRLWPCSSYQGNHSLHPDPCPRILHPALFGLRIRILNPITDPDPNSDYGSGSVFRLEFRFLIWITDPDHYSDWGS